MRAVRFELQVAAGAITAILFLAWDGNHRGRMFALLQFMFSIVETGRKQLSPVATVRAGG